jgi:GntR family transcriptional regulator
MNHDTEPELLLQGGVSISRQIQTQIRDCIVTGQLNPGEQLPTVRATSVALAVNPQPVRQAYQELEREGFLTSEEGSGIFVASLPPLRSRQAAFRPECERLCQEFLAQAARYGFSSADVITLIEELNERRLSS